MSFYTSISNYVPSPFTLTKMFLFGVAIFILLLGSLSILVDPEKLYLKKYLMERKLENYVISLIGSENGIISAVSERLLKMELIKISNAKCFILGSSRAMQASLRSKSWISDQCKSLANLGVAGGTFEDVIIYSSIIMKKNGKKIFIFLDPWALNFNSDIRWMENEKIYHEYMKKLGVGNESEKIYSLAIFLNAFNYEYVKESFKVLFSNGLGAFLEFNEIKVSYAPDFEISKGYEKTVILPDGSLVYSSSYIEKTRERVIDDGDYKISGAVLNKKAASAFLKTVDLLRQKNHDVTFILSPYHPRVFSSDGNEVVVKKIREIESYIFMVAEQKGINVIGGYDPNVSGCNGNEFYDAIHPKFSCIAKLFQR